MTGLTYYATRTGTRRNLDAMRAAGMGLLITPDADRTEGFEVYAIDNGRWGAAQTGKAWAEAKFLRLVERFGARAQFLAVPDVVADARRTLDQAVIWLPRLSGACSRLLVVLQDGMTEADVSTLLSPGVGLFLGGSTEWKLATMESWGRFAAQRGLYYHVGRVNSEKRMALAIGAGADSADGTSASRFAKTVGPLCRAAGQADLYSPRRCAA